MVDLLPVPRPPHPGGFGVARKYDVHTGVDLYAPEGRWVSLIEPGRVVAIEDFTGVRAGSPWWHDTLAVLVEGDSGVLLYGELKELPEWIMPGKVLSTEKLVGRVARVLKKDKGLPTSMLHMELYKPGTRSSSSWKLAAPPPATLLDPTKILVEAYDREHKMQQDYMDLVHNVMPATLKAIK